MPMCLRRVVCASAFAFAFVFVFALALALAWRVLCVFPHGPRFSVKQQSIHQSIHSSGGVRGGRMVGIIVQVVRQQQWRRVEGLRP